MPNRISSAALLLDKNGQRFTDELQPRDKVSQAIFAQMEKEGSDCVWEDMRPLGKDVILSHFPNIYQQCLGDLFSGNIFMEQNTRL